MRLEFPIIVEIRSNYIRTNSADELVADICERWYIDDAPTIRALYRAVKEYHPYMGR
jgi:hypothetical protein